MITEWNFKFVECNYYWCGFLWTIECRLYSDTNTILVRTYLLIIQEILHIWKVYHVISTGLYNNKMQCNMRKSKQLGMVFGMFIWETNLILFRIESWIDWQIVCSVDGLMDWLPTTLIECGWWVSIEDRGKNIPADKKGTASGIGGIRCLILWDE